MNVAIIVLGGEFLKSIIIVGASLIAQSVKNLPAMQETQVQFLGREDPLEEGTPAFLAGESHGQRSLAKSRTRLKRLST